MSKERNGKKKSDSQDKTVPSKSTKEKRKDKIAKRIDKENERRRLDT
ncbi:Uncharacterised protein [Elizabethkingia miricola]|uniref:Uncharacterized protein n=1 Tax=Elizabethkingia miricola TaxID=172045 RepID=A0ABY3NCC9_ELIMR|nr:MULTISPECIES: hypothetical protein [Elizabethkingia]MCL1654376.1 hypothetical protein [Elizabethkingia miricola]MCL1657134.1 hypothetical protein [Elizabethkingia miricola]MCL1680910.1 hypothetical protein [Elizabethkingia miricola]MCP1251196.1 hypothetical protein [Elizabethkingia sp. S0634]MDX8569493.1 hypothetical protein [Elizabethkingia sp. HX XZB]